MAKRILIPIPSRDFDPTESAIPWKILKSAGVELVFATPNGSKGDCDHRMLDGTGLGPLSFILAANRTAKATYLEMNSSSEFNSPIKWSSIEVDNFDGIILPGGHAKGMREYLESPLLQNYVSQFFELEKPVGAICHGVVLAARSKTRDNRSCLYGRKTTALLGSQEMTAWLLTCTWLGDYYRTYPESVQAEVSRALADKSDFVNGPTPLFRDDPSRLFRGFVVKDKNYISARWPGDAHQFGNSFLDMIR